MDSTEARVIVALDFPDQAKAIELVERLDPGLCRLKVGKEMFTRYGPPFVEQLRKRGFDIFLDLKFHDIPNTVAAACDAAADLEVWMMNLHASGGRRMMVAARERLDDGLLCRSRILHGRSRRRAGCIRRHHGIYSWDLRKTDQGHQVL